MPNIPNIPTPAEAAAVGICLLSRIFPFGESHPGAGCRWCGFTKEELDKAIAYFEITAEWDGYRYRADHIREFYALPEHEQKRLVREAQAIPVPA